MKCKYRFKIDSTSYVVNSFPIKIDKFTYYFENDKKENKTTHLIVQIDNYQDDLPKVKTSKNNSKPTEFYFSSIDHNYIKNELITLQGVFSLWGIYRIYFEDKEIVWIPENEKENESLPYSGISITRNKQNITEIPFSIFAYSILCIKDLEQYSMQLNFFRRGKIEYLNEQYRDSFIYFYLIIESFYGNGKSNENELIKQYQRSKELNEIVKKILEEDKIYSSITDYYSFIIKKTTPALPDSTN